jgi:hypothetical protein
MARLTSDFFVSQLMRKVAGDGGFAAVAKKGASEAGAIYIAIRERAGTVHLYGPAPQQSYNDDRPTERYFINIEAVSTDQDISNFVDAETRFDPDFWLVELELNRELSELPFTVTML